ncbi:MAG: hypothetical protein VX642_07520 [Bdellovibrionota bacterium]|nr:hypothetical protein [Bdellovibrionota bacterium]
MSKFVLAFLFLAACAKPVAKNNKNQNNDDPIPEKPSSKTHTEVCLEKFGLPDALLKAEIHKFNKDCDFLELTESAIIESYEMEVKEIAPREDCIEVEQVLRQIDDKKTKLSSYKEMKRSIATNDFQDEIAALEAAVNSLENSPILAKEKALVFIKAKMRPRFVRELERMEKSELSYSLDSIDIGNRKIVLKSYLVKDLDREVKDNTFNRIPNLFYCSLDSSTFKNQTFMEYKGNFNGRPFVDVYSASLDSH